MTSLAGPSCHPGELVGKQKRKLSQYQMEIVQKFHDGKMTRVEFPESRPCSISGDHNKWMIKFKNNQDQDVQRELVCIGDGMNVYVFEYKERLFIVEFFA